MFNHCPPVELIDLHSETTPNGRYYTLPDGSRLPSVTTVLGATKKKYIEEWRARVGDEAADKICAVASRRGTDVHTLCEDYLNNKPRAFTTPDALEMFLSLRPVLHNIDNIHYQECALYSKTVGMAGRVDCIGEYKKRLSIIDFKTSKKIKKRDDILDYFWQTTAYALMYKELTGISVKDIVIIMAVDNESPLVFREKVIDHIPGLVNAIKTYKELTNSGNAI